MKYVQKIPMAFILAICLILSCIPAFANDANTPGFGTPDSGPPVLHSISIDKTEVNAPGTITITAEADDDVSGVDFIEVRFTNRLNGRDFYEQLRNSYHDFETNQDIKFDAGIYGATIQVSQYEPTGLFELEYAGCYDVAKNEEKYYSKNYSFPDQKKLPNELSFFVHNADEDGNSHNYGITNPNLANELENLPEGTTANIAFGNTSELPSSVFDAIKGKDKTIALTGNGIQWIFNGKDITEDSKNIDLAVGISGNSNWEIRQLVGHDGIYTISFPDNGQLPGKAKIRIKADAAMKQALGQSGVYVYYYDDENNKLVNVASDITVTSDSYFEFDITHCSSYVMTKGKATGSAPDPDVSDTTPPILQSFSVDKTESSAPVNLNYTFKVSDDISGVSQVKFVVKDAAGNIHFEEYMRYTTANGEFVEKCKLSENVLISTYYIASIEISDRAGNKSLYQSNREPPISGAMTLPYEVETKITRIDKIDYDKEIHLSEPTLIQQIKDVPDGSTIRLNRAGASSTIPGEVLDAIYNTNKSLIIYGDDIWTVAGKDVFNEHSDDFEIDVSEAYGDDDKIVFIFKYAGRLPAKFTVKTRAQYLAEEGRTTDLYIYRLSPTTWKPIELISSGVSLTPDEKLPMTISYGGEYVVTQNRLDLDNVTPEPNPTPPWNNSGVSSGGSNGGSSSGGSRSSGGSKTSTPMLKAKNNTVALTNPKTLSATPAQAPATNYGTVDIDRGAHDLVMLYMGSLNLSENEYAEYYINNYEALYKKFHEQLEFHAK